MSTAKVHRMILNRIGSGGTVLVAILLDLPPEHSFRRLCDGTDALGNAVFLVGRRALGEDPDAQAVVEAVLSALAEDRVPAAVVTVAYAPLASEALAGIVEGPALEILVHGERGTGKTQIIPGSLAILAELRTRAGLPLPLVAMLAGDTLANLSAKLGASLEEETWAGTWSLHDDRHVALLTVGGRVMVRANFVGCEDPNSGERLRNAAHALFADEVIPTLTESGGVELKHWQVALNSTNRLATTRRVAVALTNPGSPETWVYKHFLEGGGQPGTAVYRIPASDRLTDEQQAALHRDFHGSADLAARLARGEWAPLLIGEVVAVGFRPELHVASRRLEPVPGAPLVLGHDAGLSPVSILGQEVRGEIRVLAALVSDRAGTRQHLEALVLPWLATRCPWAVRGPSSLLHFYDPSMGTPDQSNLESSPLRVLREVLGGATLPGAVSWPARRDPMLAVLNRLNPLTGRPVLQVCPEGCQPLISALSGRWHYPVTGGVVSRELPAKTHPASDLGDAFCYFIGGIAPRRESIGPLQMTPIVAFDPFDYYSTHEAEEAYDRSHTQ